MTKFLGQNVSLRHYGEADDLQNKVNGSTSAPWRRLDAKEKNRSLLLCSRRVFENLAWRLTNSFQSLFRARKIWESLTDPTPTFLAIHIHEKSCVQCNVISAYACSGVQDTI